MSDNRYSFNSSIKINHGVVHQRFPIVCCNYLNTILLNPSLARRYNNDNKNDSNSDNKREEEEILSEIIAHCHTKNTSQEEVNVASRATTKRKKRSKMRMLMMTK